MIKQLSVLSLLLLLQSCSQPEQSYFPTEKGLNWQYAVTITTMDLVKKSKYLVRNMGQDRIEDQEVLVQETHNGAQFLYAVSEEGVKRKGIRHKLDIRTRLEKQDYYLLRYPVQPGTRWEQQSSTGVLEVVIAPFRRHYALHTPVKLVYEVQELLAQVKVKAGTYTDCLHIRGTGRTNAEGAKSLGTMQVEVIHDDWFCRGVGLVRTHRLEKTDSKILVKGSYEMELERLERLERS